MTGYPSRDYVTQRTQKLRRVYSAVAVVIVLILAGVILYRLSDNDQAQPQPAPEPQPEPIVVEPQPKPEPRAVMPLPKVKPEPQPQPEPIPQEPPQLVEQGDAEVAAVLAEAQNLITTQPNQVIRARDMLNDILHKPMTGKQRQAIKAQLSAMSKAWLFSDTVYPQDNLCGIYKVQAGEILSSIARRHKVAWEIIQELNHLPRPEALQAGQNIKIINGPFHVRVYRSTFTLDIYLQDTYVRSFPVGLGMPGQETPLGEWVVEPGGRMIKPRWTNPKTGRTYEPTDPDYPLGSRWIGLEGISGAAVGRTGFAIHGTKDPAEIGVAKSQGCIRLHNGNAILVYNLLMPGVSRVEVVD